MAVVYDPAGGTLVDFVGGAILDFAAAPAGPNRVVSSRLRHGRLAFQVDAGEGGLIGPEFSCQALSVRLTPARETVGSDTTTICGRKTLATVKTVYTLSGTSVQDFDSPDGFVLWAFTHAGELQPFQWSPSPAPTSPTWSGTVRVRAVEIGGDVNRRLSTPWAWKVEGAVTYRPGTPVVPATPETLAIVTELGDVLVDEYGNTLVWA